MSNLFSIVLPAFLQFHAVKLIRNQVSSLKKFSKHMSKINHDKHDVDSVFVSCFVRLEMVIIKVI